MSSARTDRSVGADEPPISLYRSSRPRLRGRSGTIASTVSTITVVVVLVALLASPSAAAFRRGFLDVHQMWVAFVGDPAKGILSVGKGFLLNLWLSLVCEAIVLVLALAVATLRLSTGPVLLPLRALAIAYCDFARGVPVILVMLWVGFGVPSLNVPGLSTQSPVVYAGFVLVFAYTAYVAEVYRAGILSVPRNQVQAARSLGLSTTATLRSVVLPQAVRNVLPALLNDFTSLQKDTAIVSVVGVLDAVHAAQIAGGVTFNYSGFTIASLLFLAVTIPLTRYTDRIMAKDRGRRFNLFPHLSVLDNVTLAPRRVLGTSKATAEAEAMVLLDRIGLAQKAGEYPDRLSGGQQQRVAIVRSLAMGPRLLLLDEITSALDPELVSEVLGLVAELADQGMTMLLATHEMGFAREVADAVCFLEDGRIVESGTPTKIFEDPDEEATRRFLQRIIDAGRL